MISNLLLNLTNATECAAIVAHKWLGLGNEKAADKAAVDAMRTELNKIEMEGVVVIGEGERDKAPMLFIGEKVGTGFGLKIDIALDPLEGTTILATGANDSLSVLAATNSGSFLNAPDVYMDKIAIGLDFKEQIIDLNNSPQANLAAVAKAKKCNVSELTTMILDRPRHSELIAKVRESGARVKLIKDGDIAGIIATTNGEIDIYMGIGGAPEGVLAAAALCATGGQMCGRLLFKDKNEQERAKKMGITDLSKQYFLSDLASGDIIFSATGVTNGAMVRGVHIANRTIQTETLAMLTKTKEIKKISTLRKINPSLL